MLITDLVKDKYYCWIQIDSTITNRIYFQYSHNIPDKIGLFIVFIKNQYYFHEFSGQSRIQHSIYLKFSKHREFEEITLEDFVKMHDKNHIVYKNYNRRMKINYLLNEIH